jgi:hypothetical protein
MKIIGANITGSFILNSQDVTTAIQTSNVWSGSVATDITALNASTASLNRATASLLNYTSSNNAAIADILLETASFNAFTSSILNYTSSNNATIADILLETASINFATASLLSYTSSQNNRNGTYATTGSNTFTGIQTVNSNLVVTGSITAQTLIVQTITSSQDFVTGSTRFGSLAINTHQFTGSVIVTGSLNATAFTGSGAGLTSIPNAALTNSTISGIALGSNLATLTIGTGLSGTSYNGSGAVTIANTGVTSNVAGTGITVSGATGAVTITNSGVTSIVAGTNISISGATGAVTVTNSITNNNQLTNGAGYITSAGNAATATALSSGQSNWSGTGVLGNAVGLLAWKNYGNSHVIFDASAGTSPSGGGVNQTNATTAWTATYPTLMGWNGSGTYGVRVDSARVADSAGTAGALSSMNISQFTNNSGYLTSVGIANMTDVHRLFNNMGQNHGTYQDFNSVGNFGVRYMQGSTNGPQGGQHYGFTLGLGNDYAYGTYGSQFYWLRNTTNPYIWIRFQENGSWGAWTKAAAGLADGITGALAITGAITATGDITAFYSDGRLKENLKTISNPIEKINTLTGYTYNTNNLGKTLLNTEDDNDSKVGLIAQDLQKVLPEAVKLAPFDRDEEGNSKSGENYLTIQYEKIVPLLIEAIKEQQTQIDELKAKLA